MGEVQFQNFENYNKAADDIFWCKSHNFQHDLKRIQNKNCTYEQPQIQLLFICSNSITETLEKDVEYVQS